MMLHKVIIVSVAFNNRLLKINSSSTSIVGPWKVVSRMRKVIM